MKRILIALDPDPDTPVATEYGIALAKAYGASVTGLAVVDTSNIYPTGIVGEPDRTHHARNLWEELTDESRSVAEHLLSRFEEKVQDAKIPFTAIKKEGASYERIIEGMKYHDLLIIGRDSHFFYNEPKRDTKTLAQIVKNGVCPTFVVNDQFTSLSRILIAFDGSSPAARSMKSFVQNLANPEMKIDLLTVQTKANRNNANEINGYAASYLNAHGLGSIEQILIQSDSPDEVILKHQSDISADCTVLGAHAVSAIKRLAFGSTTHKLITNTSSPLFLSP
jgi:nucleotide-binding universal stress UspA family protein